MLADKTIRKRIFVVVIATILLIGIYNLYLFATRYNKREVKVVTAPSTAKITFTLKNDSTKKYTFSSGTSYIPHGSYSYTIAKDGFESMSGSFNTSDSNNIIVGPLTAVSSNAKTWAKNNQKEYQTVEGYAGIIANASGKDFSNKYPVVNMLPIKQTYFTIGYYTKDNHPVIVIRTASPQYRYKAIAMLVQQGVKLSDYPIEYADYQSPLGEL